jgi:serine phosphatase RsbU (regulator of sigma subunit)
MMRVVSFLIFLMWMVGPALPGAAQSRGNRLLKGQVVDANGKPLAAASVALAEPDIGPAQTDENGVFTLETPKQFVPNRQTVFVVNQKRVGREGFSYHAGSHQVSISLARRADSEPLRYVEVFGPDGQPVAGVSLQAGASQASTNAQGRAELPAPVDQATAVQLTGYAITERNFVAESQTLFLYVKPTGKPVPRPVIAPPVEPVVATPGPAPAPTPARVEAKSVQQDFNLALNELEMQKQTLEDQGERLEKRMEEIANSLQNQSLHPEAKKALQQALKKLEAQFVANGLAYENAQERIQALINQIKGQLTDSLTSVADAKIQTIEAEKAAISQAKAEAEARSRRNLQVFLGVGAALLLLTLGAVGIARKINGQKKQIELANGQLAQSVREISAQKEEITSQRDHIEQKNRYLEHAYEEIKQQKGEIERQNHLITTSIRYAESIQAAILPSPVSFAQAFNEHFVLFFPKDIVSGDFYWCTTHGDTTVLAVVDCTGHGVPGAFMSLIAHNLFMDEIQKNLAQLSPAAILSGVNERLERTLHQEHSLNDDSLDVALCVVSPQANGRRQVRFAGAKRGLLYHQAQGNRLSELRGSRHSLGGGYRKKSAQDFAEHTLDLAPGDALYLYTDGLTDQADADKEKFGTTGLRRELERVAPQPLGQQQAHLHQLLLGYLNQGRDQRDDITLVAVRL